ncbi:FAD binding domain-containing protein [Paenibacillus sp. LS1]|uniref:FAD binding domain-containing protein n=1 Tax=Paenibacillus sp. LS1 TaxID=2992120 RepID=UPI00223146FC|nr:FAD binding domain-containing protein [Paenibacillus sp. LS1]MCW3790513.1 FAD binding domain-containing protein [Paenibacillus sp. LS1]
MVTPAYGSGAMPSVWQPENLQELLTLRSRLKGIYCFTAGGTLLRTQWEGGLISAPEHMISLGRIPEMSGVSIRGDELVIGAMTRLKESASQALLHQLPILQEAVNAIAAPSIRNVATIGGNVVSGVGDTLTALLVYDAELHWLTDSGIEIRSVSSWLQGGRDGSRNSGDVLISIHIPIRTSSMLDAEGEYRSVAQEVSFYRKLGRRETFSASLVTVALYGEIDSDNRWTKIAIAAGGGSGMAMRLLESEQQLLGSEASVIQAATLAAAVASEFTTYGDAFATEHYRKQTAGNMLGAGLWEALHE